MERNYSCGIMLIFFYAVLHLVDIIYSTLHVSLIAFLALYNRNLQGIRSTSKLEKGSKLKFYEAVLHYTKIKLNWYSAC